MMSLRFQTRRNPHKRWLSAMKQRGSSLVESQFFTGTSFCSGIVGHDAAAASEAAASITGQLLTDQSTRRATTRPVRHPPSQIPPSATALQSSPRWRRDGEERWPPEHRKGRTPDRRLTIAAKTVTFGLATGASGIGRVETHPLNLNRLIPAEEVVRRFCSGLSISSTCTRKEMER